MTTLLRKVFPIESGEGMKVIQFALIGLLMQVGVAMGTSAADSAFLSNVGADKLPRIYLLVPVAMLFYVPACSALLTRWDVYRVLCGSMALMVVGGAGLWYGMAHLGTHIAWVCYAAKLYTSVWYVAIYTLYWTFIDAYFDMFDAKRLYALLAAGSALGSIVGGILVGVICRFLRVEYLFLAWAAFAAAALPVTIWTKRSWRRLQVVDEDDLNPVGPILVNLLGIMRKMSRTRYALVLTIVLFATLVATSVCEFQYFTLFSQNRTEAQLASLFGRLMAAANIFNLVVTLFVFERLVKRIGVRNVALIQCSVYVVVFSWLLLDGGFTAAVAGFFAFQGLMTSVDFNNANLLLTGLPVEGGKQMRTVIEGICEPMATAFAGACLFFAASSLSQEQISLGGVVISLVGIAFVFVLRHDYVVAISANLRRNWLDLSGSAVELWRGVGKADVDQAALYSGSHDTADVLVAFRILRYADPARALQSLIQFLKRRSVADQSVVAPILAEVLAQPASGAASEIRRWLANPETVLSPGLAPTLGQFGLMPSRRTDELRESKDPRERGAAAAVLWRSWRVEDGRKALQQVEELLRAGDGASLRAGLEVLGHLGEPRYAYLLRDFLKDPSPEVRRVALASLRALSEKTVRILTPEVLSLMETEDGQGRLLALEVFERMADSASIPPALAAVRFFTPAECRRLERLIVELGPRAVPMLVGCAQDDVLSAAGRTVAMRALSKLALPQMKLLARPLVESIAKRAYVYVSGLITLEESDGPEAGRTVLKKIAMDNPDIALDLILQVLALSGSLPDSETLMMALRGGQSKERGYAIESIEQACHRDTFSILLPLVDGRTLAAQAQFGRSMGMATAFPERDLIIRALDSTSPLAVAAAVQSLLAGGGPEADELVLSCATRARQPLLASTLLPWLARRGRGGPAAEIPTPVELMAELIMNRDFAPFRSSHYEFLAGQARALSLGPGSTLSRQGEPLAGVLLVRSGEVVRGDGRIILPGTLAGAELLNGSRTAGATITARTETSVIFVPAAALRRCAEINPALSVALLARKLAA